MQSTRISFLCCCLLAALATRSAHADWPQFRGSNAAGVAQGKPPPVDFGPDLNVKWKLDLAPGHSSPCVVGDHVYLTTVDEAAKQLSVLAIDRESGKVKWSFPLVVPELERGHPSFNPASSTVASDGKHVVAYFGSHGLICLDTAGQKIWEFKLPLTKSYAGNAISPVIAAGKVILYRGNYVDHFLLAVDVSTGEECWRTAQAEPFHAELACTGVPIIHNQNIVLHSARSVQGFDLETGEQAWITKCATTATTAPLVVGDRVLVAAWNKMGEPALRPSFPSFTELVEAHDANLNGVIEKDELPRLWIFHRPEGAEAPQNGATIRFGRVDRDKDNSISAAEWNTQLGELERFRKGYESHGLLSLPTDQTGVLAADSIRTLETQGIPEVPSPISDGKYVYLIKNGGLITCLDPVTGKRVYRMRSGGTGTHYASPIIAGEHLYLSDGQGTVTVMSLGPEPKIVAQNEMGDGVYATPAADDGVLYVRTHHSLFAFEAAQ